MNNHILLGIDICKNYKLVIAVSLLLIFFIYQLIVVEHQHIMIKK